MARATIAHGGRGSLQMPPDFMQIRVLGCSGSIAAGNRTTSFLVDDDMLIDAGTGVGDLTLDELARIDRIFITHIKPGELDGVMAEIARLDTPHRIRQLAAGQVMRVG